MKDKAVWIHYWPLERSMKIEYKSGKVIMETLSPNQANMLCNSIERLVKQGIGYVMLPRWFPYDWVWIRK